MTGCRRASLLFALFAAAAAGCGREAPDEVETQTVVPVTTAPAAIGSVRAAIHASGTVEPAPGADLVVIAPETARILEIPRAEGDRVRKGDLLVRFEIPSLRADAATRRAEVERAEARLTNARAARTRAHDLFDRGVAARKEVEDADRELAEAEAALREAQSGQQASALLSQRTEVRARFDGIVARRAHNPGDLVEASSSDPVLRVIDPNRLEVVAAVPLTDLPQVSPGTSARLVMRDGEPSPDLKVVSRPAAVDAQTGTAPVRLAFVTRTTLPAGTPVQVDIDGQEHRNVVVVPASAIVHEADEAAVFVVNDNKAHRTPVTTGISASGQVEIRSGVKPGDQVIVRGQNGLPDGAAVSVGTEKQ